MQVADRLSTPFQKFGYVFGGMRSNAGNVTVFAKPCAKLLFLRVRDFGLAQQSACSYVHKRDVVGDQGLAGYDEIAHG